jgi:hypothetical protein
MLQRTLEGSLRRNSYQHLACHRSVATWGRSSDRGARDQRACQ